jgi:hypothetical protein
VTTKALQTPQAPEFLSNHGAVARFLDDLGDLLAIGEPSGIRSAHWSEGRLFLELSGPDLDGQVFFFDAKTEGAQGFRVTEHLVLSYIGQELGPALQSFLEELSERVQSLEYTDLQRTFPPHMEVVSQQELPPESENERAPVRHSRTPVKTKVKELPSLLKLEPPDSSFDKPLLVAAEWWTDQLLLEVETPDVEPFVMILEARNEERSGLIDTEHLSIGYEGSTLTPPQEAFLRDFAPSLSHITFDDLRAAMPFVPTVLDLMAAASADAQDVQFHACGMAHDAETGFDTVTRVWNGTNQWHRFLCSKEIDRQVQRSIDLVHDGIYVEHGDIECRFAAPTYREGVPSFVNFPWRKEIARHEKTKEESEEDQAAVSFGYLTNLDDADVVLGGSDKLRNMLDEVHKLFPTKPIHFNCTCPPIVIADEVNATLQDFRKKHEAPVVFTTQDPGSPLHNFCDLLRKSCGEITEVEAGTGINLVGFGTNAGTRELTSLLERAEIRVNVNVLPHSTRRLLEAYSGADTQIFYPNGQWYGLYKLAFSDLPLESLYTDAPFGIAGTRSWLQSVGDSQQKSDAVRTIFDETFATLEPRWERLRSRAHEHRLGIVLHKDELIRLENPSRNLGVPILSMLHEMGFGIDLMCFDPQGDLTASCATLLETLCEGENPHRVLPFATQDELQKHLSEPQLSAVFSEYFYDWRLTSTGLGQFHLAFFESGIQGAIDSLERLLSVCSNKFYRRYGRYLKRAHYD